MRNPLAIRWTLGDVSARGYEALRLSLWGATHVFGPESKYAVCVNTITLDEARERVGDVPVCVEWHSSEAEMPPFLLPHLGEGHAGSKAWKLAPLRLDPERYELSLDHDCILWSLPNSVRQWLEEEGTDRCLLAEDVSPGLGQFASIVGSRALSSGIRGLPPAHLYDHGETMRRILDESDITLRSGADETGLQVAAILSHGEPLVVRMSQVTPCSPWPPHLDFLGTSGAHFVGLDGPRDPGETQTREAAFRHFDSLRPFIESRVYATTPTRVMLA